jgi:transcriptional regulator with XRE-family HTH domain
VSQAHSSKRKNRQGTVPRDNLGEVLKNARLARGLSQGDVAKALGYGSPQFISNIERDLAHPPLTIISKLVEMYNLDSNIVLGIMVSQYTEKVAHALRLAKSRKSS